MTDFRGAPRKVSDKVVDYLLGHTEEWSWPLTIARTVGLTETQVKHSLKFLSEEYDAVELLPSTGCAKLMEAGFDRYCERSRNYHPAHLWPVEREMP